MEPIAVRNEKALGHEKDEYKDDVESTPDSASEYAVLNDARDLVTQVISVADDPTLNPWTLRAFIIGIGLSAFGGVLGWWFLSSPHE